MPLVRRRPSGVGCKNFTTAFVVDLNQERKRRKPKRLRLPRIVGLLEQAVEFQRLLESRQTRFRADLARRNGLSAMRVTQILALLKLAPSIIEYIRNLPAGTPERRVSERGLRRFTKLDRHEQVAEAHRRLPGFAAFLAGRKGSAA